MRNCLTKNWLHKRYLISNIQEALSLIKPGILLDIGCGSQPYRSLVQSLGFQYLGIDMINSEHDLKHVNVYGSALELPIKKKAIDVVLSTQVLEHVFNPDQMIKETCRILKSGGYLVLTAPHIWCVHEPPHDYFRFTKFGLEYLINKNNFELKYIKAMGGFWVTWSTRLSYYLFPERVQNKSIRLLVGVICSIIQLIGLILDKLHTVEYETHNYIAVAKKK